MTRCCCCFCDSGDTVNGICDKCREEIEQEEQKEKNSSGAFGDTSEWYP